ncbi:[LysW]-aminoadipate/[LysW]-glutamate kinase [Candidatus Bathyarchaeota archaeon]|nr:[LysW]-aminoadipate/[LysW]-glutamate kinase [Candidatus Bathyarchaeota archaeon]
MIVLKIGGDIYKEGLSESLIDDVKEAFLHGGIIIVHGGGDEVTEIAERLGKKQVFVTSPSGIRSRYTDKETVEIYTMVMAGRINKLIVQQLISHGLPAVGLSGVDGSILRASRKKRLLIIDERGRKRIIEGGYTGKIDEVNTEVLRILLENGYLPVIAPIALGKENELLNVDSDRVAASIAGALKAERLIFLTDVKGVMIDGKYVESIPLREAERLISTIGSGMDKKLLASTEALKNGVKKVVITSGFIESPIKKAINQTSGTVITVG